MSNARRTKKRSSRFSGPENPPLVDKLVRYGASFPSVPGLARSTVSLAPSAMRTVLRYTRQTTLTSTIGSTVQQVFSGNGLFDPDITGAGGQPLGFDQWAALYQKYRVLASCIEVSVLTPSAAANGNALDYMLITPVSDASAFTTFEAGAAQPYAKSWVNNGITGTKVFVPFSSSMETSLILGVSKATVLSDDELNAPVTANPSNQWYWNVSARSADGTSTSSMYLLVTLSYLVDFWERNLPGLSLARPLSYSHKAPLPEKTLTPDSTNAEIRARLTSLLLGD
jgi:hypothetical protein